MGYGWLEYPTIYYNISLVAYYDIHDSNKEV